MSALLMRLRKKLMRGGTLDRFSVPFRGFIGVARGYSERRDGDLVFIWRTSVYFVRLLVGLYALKKPVKVLHPRSSIQQGNNQGSFTSVRRKPVKETPLSK